MKRIDVGALLLGNLERVFNERNRDARDRALAEFWTDNPVMYEADEVLMGPRAISAGVEKIHAKMPAEVRFRPVGSAVENHGTALLRWEAGVPGAPALVSGVDVAMILDDRIHTLHVYLEKAPS